MTIKEVARDLGVSEWFIRKLIDDGLIDYYVIGKRINNPNKPGNGKIIIRQIGIDPEEVDYIDWYLNIGKHENENIIKYVQNDKDFQKQNKKKKITISICY